MKINFLDGSFQCKSITLMLVLFLATLTFNYINHTSRHIHENINYICDVF